MQRQKISRFFRHEARKTDKNHNKQDLTRKNNYDMITGKSGCIRLPERVRKHMNYIKIRMICL